MSALVAFAIATALHAGFQVTVTVLVYPVLARRGAEEWRVAHERHSRSIAPLVGVVYLALLVTGGWLVASGPDTAGWVALALTAAALATTAGAAAPVHGRLADRDDRLVARLLVVDRWRCAFAVLGAVTALVAVATGG
ncbi:hypothetical protein [Nocardioides sp. Soil805]|uniref:hypothetical protein n=1 Tax=Nocardioides sp. Soil805 TaxID=1736416 RepID=UPI0007026A77|nr:hypothetical protein [Nocardioides sp. Soil805]KRF35323.1 hypothetical protein ASG94_14575 [Nocardioides sp. Soil805]